MRRVAIPRVTVGVMKKPAGLLPGSASRRHTLGGYQMGHSFRHGGLILSAVMLLGGASAVAVGQAALAAPNSGAATSTPASARAARSAGLLNAVAAVSAKNVWAVGCSGGCNGPDSLILHWNGKKWSKVASPDPGAGLDELTGVSAVSASNVWASATPATRRAARPSRL